MIFSLFLPLSLSLSFILSISIFMLFTCDISRFVGGQLNTCYNALDRHVDGGNGDQVAIIFDSPVSKQMDKITYKELLHEVCQNTAEVVPHP